MNGNTNTIYIYSDRVEVVYVFSVEYTKYNPTFVSEIAFVDVSVRWSQYRIFSSF